MAKIDNSELAPEEEIDTAQFAALCNTCALAATVDRVLNVVPGAMQLSTHDLGSIVATAVAMGAYVGAGLSQTGVEAPDEELEEFARMYPRIVVHMHQICERQRTLMADTLGELAANLVKSETKLDS